MPTRQTKKAVDAADRLRARACSRSRPTCSAGRSRTSTTSRRSSTRSRRRTWTPSSATLDWKGGPVPNVAKTKLGRGAVAQGEEVQVRAAGRQQQARPRVSKKPAKLDPDPVPDQAAVAGPGRAPRRLQVVRLRRRGPRRQPRPRAGGGARRSWARTGPARRRVLNLIGGDAQAATRAGSCSTGATSPGWRASTTAGSASGARSRSRARSAASRRSRTCSSACTYGAPPAAPRPSPRCVDVLEARRPRAQGQRPRGLAHAARAQAARDRPGCGDQAARAAARRDRGRAHRARGERARRHDQGAARRAASRSSGSSTSSTRCSRWSTGCSRLAQGRKLIEGEPREVMASPKLRDVYLGRELLISRMALLELDSLESFYGDFQALFGVERRGRRGRDAWRSSARTAPASRPCSRSLAGLLQPAARGGPLRRASRCSGCPRTGGCRSGSRSCPRAGGSSRA